MSQLGKEGLLDESELSEQVQRFLDLKLEKEALMRPTKELVMELYARFLDKSGYDWRRTNNGKEPIIMARMLNVLKIIFSRYSIDYEFNLSDIIFPTRKRTTTFMNVIIYLLALLEEKLEHMQQLQEEDAVMQQKLEQVNKELAEKRLAIDELALWLGQSKSADELRSENAALQRRLEEQKLRCELKKQEGEAIKKAIEEEKATAARLRQQIQQKEEHLSLNDEVIKLEKQEAHRREKLAMIKNEGTKRLKQAEIELSQAKRDLHMKRNELTKFEEQASARIKQLDTEILEVEKRRDALLARYEQGEIEFAENIERADKQLADLKIQCENSMKTERDIYLAMIGQKEKLESLMGENKVVQPPETDKNTTFIKSKALKDNSSDK